MKLQIRKTIDNRLLYLCLTLMLKHDSKDFSKAVGFFDKTDQIFNQCRQNIFSPTAELQKVISLLMTSTNRHQHHDVTNDTGTLQNDFGKFIKIR